MNAATGCLHAAPCLAAGRYCGMMLWGDAVGSVEHHSHASALLPGGIGFPGREASPTALGKLWAHHGTCSAHTLGSLHILPVLLHSPICAVPLGRPRPVSLYGCASSREKALSSPACSLTLLPAWDCSPPNLSWVGAGIAAIPPALLQHEWHPGALSSIAQTLLQKDRFSHQPAPTSR